MLLPKGGLNWKAAQARLPPSRAVYSFVFRVRFLLTVAIVGTILLFWRSVTSSAADMQRYALPACPDLDGRTV